MAAPRSPQPDRVRPPALQTLSQLIWLAIVVIVAVWAFLLIVGVIGLTGTIVLGAIALALLCLSLGSAWWVRRAG